MKAIYVILEGRLGNNLWQIAAAATLAERLQVPFYAVPNKDYFCPEPDNCPFPEYIAPFRKTIFRDVPFLDERPTKATYLYEPNLTTIQQVPDNGLLIEGYFQDYRMINEYVLQRLYAPAEQIIQQLRQKYPMLSAYPTCAIVVRRGDYLTQPMQFPAEDMAYYQKCMRKLERKIHTKEVRYLIITDDPIWCREHFIGQRFTVVDDEPPLIDLYLSSMCQHNILSNSSFACWGALLNANPDKQVYYPFPYLGIGMRRLDNMHRTLSQTWIRVFHISKAYRQGVALWLKHGIQKYWNKFVHTKLCKPFFF